MSQAEALRNIVHREVQRFLDRRTRRVPCIVDSYNAQFHAVKVRLQPEDTLTGLIPIETPQIGLQVAPNINDHGWIEFHEMDRRAGVFVGAVHNDQFPPRKQIAAGELYYQSNFGVSIYAKTDGSITITDKAGSVVKFDGANNITVTANGSGKITLTAQEIDLVGNVVITGNLVISGDVTGGFGGVSSVDILNHTHTGVTTGGGISGPPTPGS